MFATVPDSSINSWDSWFIFNLQKINTCYYTNNSNTRIVRDGHGGGGSRKINAWHMYTLMVYL